MMGFGLMDSSESLRSILDSYRDPFETDIDAMDSSSVFEEMLSGPKDRVSQNGQRASGASTRGARSSPTRSRTT
jgi:hypothetical protein